MVFEEVMQLTNNHICSFSAISSLITQEVDLMRNCFTIDPKERAIPRCKEIYWAWLQRVAGIMDLYIHSLKW